LKTHGVTFLECEEVFFNQLLIVQGDEVHSQEEIRYYVLGQTDRERHLFIVFTIRNKRIRVISARDMNRKEKIIYTRKLKKITKFKSEKEELIFWSTHDSADYIDYTKATKVVFSHLKLSTRSISLRLSESLIEHLKFLPINGIFLTSLH
jgi:uncharacterized protein